MGNTKAGIDEQLDGGLVVPGLQLRLTLLLYPLSAESVPAKFALCAVKIVKGLFVTLIWKSGVVIRFHSQMPRP